MTCSRACVAAIARMIQSEEMIHLALGDWRIPVERLPLTSAELVVLDDLACATLRCRL
jgi:hypothetical protein